MQPSRSLTTQALKKQRSVAPEALDVAPELVGLQLASPARRALAMGIDLWAVVDLD